MKINRKLKKKLKVHGTILYIKPNLKKFRIISYNNQTLEFEILGV